MKTLFFILCLNLSLFSNDLHLQKGFVAIHTEMLLDKTIDPLSTSLQADLSIQDSDINSLRGVFIIHMKLFSSDNKNRDEAMHKLNEVKKYPFAKYTISNISKAEGNHMYIINGILNFHGKEKALEAKAEILYQDNILTLNATANILASEYNLEVPCLFFFCVRDKIDIFVKSELIVK